LAGGGHPVTRDDVIAEQKGHTDEVPDFTWRAKDRDVDGDRVAARLFNKGTPAKEWFGVPPPAPRSSTPSTRFVTGASTR
jgi:predicted ester cyclase